MIQFLKLKVVSMQVLAMKYQKFIMNCQAEQKYQLFQGKYTNL